MLTPFPALLKRLDPQDVFGSVQRFARQGRQAVADFRTLKFPKLRGKVDAIVVAGMGGSALCAHVIQAACADRLRVPLIINSDYTLPAWVGPKTLVVLSSYSGTTEEALAAYRHAKDAKANMVAICCGGTLATIARAKKIPSYIFNPVENPSNQPRIGLGYMIFGLLGIWQKTGLLRVTDAELQAAIRAAEKVGARLNLKKASSSIAGLTRQLSGRAILVVGAAHLVGAAHVFANQFNETAKSFAAWFPIPELNHHLMEGLANPKVNIRNTTFLLLNSRLYSPRIEKRVLLTKEVVKKNGAKVIEVHLLAKTKLEQAIEAVVFGSNLTLGLGLRYHVNPAEIRWVNYFKNKLGK